MKNSYGAIWRLLLTTAAWGLSFPTGKAVMLAQAALIPGREEWFHSALILFVRMALATLLMLVLFFRECRGIGRGEIVQGAALGLFGGVGMLLQTDAQHVIAASTSAFFTQFTCIFVPLVLAFWTRSLPSLRVMVASGMVLAGCAFLSGFSTGNVVFGRGEWETIAAAGLFTAQILVLGSPRFQDNDMRAAAAVMFAVKALVLFPVLLAGMSAGGPVEGRVAVGEQVWKAFLSGPVLLMTALLTVFSTVYGYATMVRWQPQVSPVQAGLIYATEPIFATLWALFLPGWFSAIGGLDYPNEVLGGPFYVGAALVLGANALLLARRPPDRV
jgi:drug/metabolite transporter (DMT)-like permease